MPVSARICARISRPRFARPWNAYGDVRCLYASPRRMCAPAAFAARADAIACSSVSIAQGPAMTTNESRPTMTSPTWISVASGRDSRATSLYGLPMRMTLSTPDMPGIGSAMKRSVSPTRPMIVRCLPRETKASPPASSTISTTRAISSSLAFGLITTTMASPYLFRPLQAKGPGVLTRGFGSAACSLQSEGPRVAGGAEEPEIPLHRGRNGRGAIPACQCGRREKPAQRMPEWTSWEVQPTG